MPVVYLNTNGQVSITPGDIALGSFSSGTLCVTPNSFNCGQLGSQTVTLTVSDLAGNSSTCTGTVTVKGLP